MHKYFIGSLKGIQISNNFADDNLATKEMWRSWLWLQKVAGIGPRMLDIWTHMTHNKEWFLHINANSCKEEIVVLVDDSTHKVQGFGLVPIKIPNGKMQRTSNVLYVFDIKRSLLSVCQIDKQNLKVEFNANRCVVIRDQQNCCVTFSCKEAEQYRSVSRAAKQ